MIPKWEDGGEFKGYARNWVRKNGWRVVNVLGDYDDCMAECAKIFVQMCNTYAETNEPPQLMIIFKLRLQSRWERLAELDKRHQHAGMEEVPEIVDYPSGNVAVSFYDISDELRAVLKIILEAPIEMLQAIFHDKNNDATVSSMLHRMFRIPGNKNVMAELRTLLT